MKANFKRTALGIALVLSSTFAAPSMACGVHCVLIGGGPGQIGIGICCGTGDCAGDCRLEIF